MSIEEKIKEIVDEKFPGISYVFENWKGAEDVVARVELPAIISLLPTGGSFDFSKGRVKMSEEKLFAFIDKVEMDANGEDNERVYSRMREVACRFVAELNASGYFEPIGDNQHYTTLFESMTTNVTGVVLPLDVKELAGNCL